MANQQDLVQKVIALTNQFRELSHIVAVEESEYFSRHVAPVRIVPWYEPRRQWGCLKEAASRHRQAIRESGEWSRWWPFCWRLGRALRALAWLWIAAVLYRCYVVGIVNVRPDIGTLKEYCG